MKKQGYVLGVICFCQTIGGSWQFGNKKQERSNSVQDKIILTMQAKGKTLYFVGDVKLEGKMQVKEFRTTWKLIKECFQKWQQ